MKQIDQSISDVVIRSDTPGVVKVIFTTEAGMPDPALIQKVTDSLMDRDIRPLTDKIEVSAPVSKTYDVEFTYYISSGEKASVASIQENIAAAVDSYNTWQTEKSDEISTLHILFRRSWKLEQKEPLLQHRNLQR